MARHQVTQTRNALGESERQVVTRRLVLTGIVVLCVLGLALAVSKTRRGDEEDATLSGGTARNPSVVELVTPQDGATLVNQQDQIGIDLTTPYDAYLVINGQAVPQDQLLRRPELSAVYFTPGKGKFLSRLPAGRNCVQAVITRVDGTREIVPAVTWCFNVA